MKLVEVREAKLRAMRGEVTLDADALAELLEHVEDAMARMTSDEDGVECSSEMAGCIDRIIENREEDEEDEEGEPEALEELWDLVNVLLRALPACDRHPDRPATKAKGRGGSRLCDECGGDSVPDYPRAASLRAIEEARERRDRE